MGTLADRWRGKEEAAAQVCFKDTAFLVARGLSPENVLEYLALSQFYDHSCLNEQLRMQARFSSVSGPGFDVNDPVALREKRSTMRGLEYDLWFFTPTPSLFVIRRQIRQSPTRGVDFALSM